MFYKENNMGIEMKMEKAMGFVPSAENEPQKMTKTRLSRLLEELNLQCSFQGEGGDFDIVIDLPQEHIEEKNILENASLLNKAILTKFDEDKFLPLVRAIKRSTNLDCQVISSDDKSKYIISVFKK